MAFHSQLWSVPGIGGRVFMILFKISTQGIMMFFTNSNWAMCMDTRKAHWNFFGFYTWFPFNRGEYRALISSIKTYVTCVYQRPQNPKPCHILSTDWPYVSEFLFKNSAAKERVGVSTTCKTKQSSKYVRSIDIFSEYTVFVIWKRGFKLYWWYRQVLKNDLFITNII